MLAAPHLTLDNTYRRHSRASSPTPILVILKFACEAASRRIPLPFLLGQQEFSSRRARKRISSPVYAPSGKINLNTVSSGENY